MRNFNFCLQIHEFDIIKLSVLFNACTFQDCFRFKAQFVRLYVITDLLMSVSDLKYNIPSEKISIFLIVPKVCFAIILKILKTCGIFHLGILTTSSFT